MNLSTLLARHLKSDEIIEVLECFNLPVLYDFDRLHENTADRYWASAHQAGFELRFNEDQVLDTIFMFASARGKFQRIAPQIAGVPFYGSFEIAKSAFESLGVQYQESAQSRWAKGQFDNRTAHYEFNTDGELALVTIGARTDA